MRIAYVTDTYVPQVNGVTTVLRRMVEGLDAAGHEVAVVAPAYPQAAPRGSARELRVASVPFPPYPDIRLSAPRFRAVHGFLDEFQPDVVHVATEGSLGFVGRRYAVARGVPLATSFHTDFPRYCRDYGVDFLAPAVWRWLVWFHGAARLTHTPGLAIAEQLRQRGLKHVEVWGRTVDSRLFHPDRRDAVLRRTLGALDGTPIVLHVGRLALEKNVPLLIESWRIAHHSLGDRAVFVIAGDGPLAPKLARSAPWVRRLGFLDRTALAALYASADLCVLTSETETLGLVALEAMASGIPVVAADAGGFRESVHHGVDGLLVDSRDAAGFAAAIIDLVMERDRRRTFGLAARHGAEDRDHARELELLETQYRDLMGVSSTEAACTAA